MSCPGVCTESTEEALRDPAVGTEITEEGLRDHAVGI